MHRTLAATVRAWLAVLVLVGVARPGDGIAADMEPSSAQLLREAEGARATQLANQRDAARRAAAARREAQLLVTRQAAALEKLRGAEAATMTVSTSVEALALRHRAAEARLAVRAADIGPLLPLMQRLALFPDETLLAVTQPAEQAVRGVLVLGGILRELEFEAQALRREQAEVVRLQSALDREVVRMVAALAAQAQAAQNLDEQLRATQAERRTAEDDAERAARLAAAEAARAEELRAAIAQIETARRLAEVQARREAELAARQRRTVATASARERQAVIAAPAGPGVEVAHGGLAAPVSGALVRGFGDPTDAGPATGLSYLSAPGARVVAPSAGRVVFAAPFRSYGLLLIIDAGRGTHVVLAGFERLDVAVGQPVAAGAPVGVMPGWDPRAGGPRPSLYVELRRDGLAVNPTPFLGAKS